MYQPAGMAKLYEEDVKPKRNIPKLLISFFFTVQFCFGLDLGFVKLLHPRLRFLVKFLTILIAIVIIFILASPLNQDRKDLYWYIIVLLEYPLYFLILQFTSYNLYDFITELMNVSDDMAVTYKSYHIVLLFAYSVVSCIMKLVIYVKHYTEVNTVYWLNYRPFLVPYFVYGLPSQCTDVIPTVLSIINYYVYCSIKSIKDSEVNILLIQKRYMAIAHCFEKIKSLYDKLIITQLLFDIPRMMGMLWFMLLYVKIDAGWFAYFSESFFSFHIILQICVPAIISEMAKSQFEAFKLILHQKLMSERDDEKNIEVIRLLRYMEVQSLQHKAWRIVPVDIGLPVSMIGVCTTYFIVIVQFTHLYD